MVTKPLNIFYEEPDPDRWLPFDRYPRKLVRRIVRGKHRPGGVMMVALELMRGLDKIGTPYRFNDYKHIKKHPEELACIVGKPHLLFNKKWDNPILFGAGVYSHPIDCPDLFQRYPNVKKMLVPGNWMQTMCAPYYGDNVIAWPVGIDTEKWSPSLKNETLKTDFLIYDKIRWERELYQETLLNPILNKLEDKGFTYDLIKYGSYKHSDLIEKLSGTRAVIFLCEHETQGIAYQQILSTGTPILAWDRGGYWQDPDYFPHRIIYEPVSSVPYWDETCGLRFTSYSEFPLKLEQFISLLNSNSFSPATYIKENLSLEICAWKYVSIHEQVKSQL